MRNIFITISALIAPHLAKGQLFVYRNSVRLALETVVTNNHGYRQPPIPRYSVLYSKQLAQSRWMAEAGLSYMSLYKDERIDPYNYYFLSDRSQRVSADLVLLFNVLKSNRHAIRFGAGPSFWYQRNGYVRNLGVYLTRGGQQVDYVTFDRANRNEFDLGLNLRSDYEYAVSSHFIVGFRLGTAGKVVQIGTKDNESYLIGTLATIGASVGYRF